MHSANQNPAGENKDLRILMLEDTIEDAELIEIQLDEAAIPFVSLRVQTRDAFVRALEEFHPDIILSDYRLPAFDGRSAVLLARERLPEVPIVMVTGAVGDELAVDLLKAGANDYVLKDRLARLPSAVLRAVGEQRQKQQRQEAESALSEAETRYREVFETSPDAIFVLDAPKDGHFSFSGANHAWEAIRGVRAREISGRSLDAVLAGDMAQSLSARCEDCVTTGSTISFEETVQAAGGLRFFHTTLTPIRDETGTVIRLFGVARDITDRKRSEEAVRRSEELYRSFVAASPDGVAVLDLDGRVIFASPKINELLGEPPETKLNGAEAVVFLAPEDRDRARAALGQMAAGALIPGEELRVVQKNGRLVYVEINGAPLLSAEGQPAAIVTVVRDATERRQALLALRESERHLREVYENSPLAYQAVDRNGRLLDVNPAWCAMMHIDHAAAVGMPFTDLLSEESKRYFSERCRFLDKDNGSQNGTAGDIHGLELDVICPGGQTYVVEIDSRIACTPDGQFREMHCILHDITERKHSDISIRRFNRALLTLSSGNEALVRASSEKDLLERMCNVLTLHGGYLAAWIGYPSTDPNEPVPPVAWAGKEVGCFSSISACRAISSSADPVRKAISQGLPVLVRDIENDPCYEGCRVDAERGGFKASLHLPLRDENGSVGALTLYSGDHTAFDPDETRLLVELSEDLTYGIRTLRMREDREKYQERLQATMEATIQALSSTVELRDPYTAGHQRRVARLAVAIARDLGLSEDRVRGLFLAALVHDIGKIHIPAEVLTRPGALSDVEYSLVKTHVLAASEILDSVDFPWPISDIVRQHHERMNGSGYPGGLRGEDTLLESRILAVSDVVEAMSSHRPYRPGLGMDAALAEIERGRGELFDAEVVDSCISLFRDDGFHFE